MTETDCVYCAARTKSWSILEANFRRFKGRAMALVVSFVLLATVAWVRPHVSPCEIMVGRVALRRVLLRFSPVSIIPIVPLSCHLHAARIRRRNGPSLGTFLKATLFRKSGGGQWIEENFHSFFFYLLRHMNQLRIVESFVFGILIAHCVAVAFLTSGHFRKGFAWKSAFITCLPMRVKCLVHLNLIFLVALEY